MTKNVVMFDPYAGVFISGQITLANMSNSIRHQHHLKWVRNLFQVPETSQPLHFLEQIYELPDLTA